MPLARFRLGRLAALAGLTLAIALFTTPPPVFAADAEKTFDAAAAEKTIEAALTAFTNGDYETAQELLRPLAEAGEKLSTALLAIVEDSLKREKQALANPSVESGISSFKVRRYDAAERMFLPFAAQGDATALMYLGLIEARRVSGFGDAAMAALPYFREAAEKGLAHAQYLAGVATGYAGQPGWEVEIEKWYTLAAQGGVPEAYSALNLFHCVRGQAELADSWAVLESSDAGFRRPMEEIEANWDEIEAYWNLRKCDSSQQVTKDFVLTRYRRAEDLIQTYGLRVCGSVPPCRDPLPPSLFFFSSIGHSLRRKP